MQPPNFTEKKLKARRENRVYLSTAERTSVFSILPPRLDAKSIAAASCGGAGGAQNDRVPI